MREAETKKLVKRLVIFSILLLSLCWIPIINSVLTQIVSNVMHACRAGSGLPHVLIGIIVVEDFGVVPLPLLGIV